VSENAGPLRTEADPRPVAPADGSEFSLRRALEEMIRRRGSDLHLKVGRPPVVRVHGELIQTPLPPLRTEDLRRAAEQLLTPRQREIVVHVALGRSNAEIGRRCSSKNSFA